MDKFANDMSAWFHGLHPLTRLAIVLILGGFAWYVIQGSFARGDYAVGSLLLLMVVIIVGAGIFLAVLDNLPTPQPEPDPEPPYEKTFWELVGKNNFPVPPQDIRDLIIKYELPEPSLIAYLKAYPRIEERVFQVPLYERVNIRQLLFGVMPHLHPTYPWELYHQNAVRLSVNSKGGDFVWPQHFKGTNEQVFQEYLHDNPLKPLFETPVPFPLYDKTRFEHQWLVANSGHGKTQTLQHMICHDLQRDCSVVVIDSQGKMIPQLARLKSVQDRVVLLQPSQVAPAINLLELTGKNLNELLHLYHFMFGTLLASEMTDNQKTLFDNCVTLLKLKPGATIRDLYDLMAPKGLAKYSHLIPKLDEFGRQFFNQDFHTKGEDGYEATKLQVRRRLNSLFRVSPYKEMFSSEHKFDLKAEMDKGKLILIDTSGLGEETRRFGRLMLALIANAMRNRTETSKPCFVYIDECDQYVKDDPTAIDLLARARKTNIGLIFAHRWLDEVGLSVAKALEATTAIIFAGGLRAGDAVHMAKVMDSTPALLKREEKMLFTVSVRGLPNTTIKVPMLTLEHADKIEEAEYEALKTQQHADYGVLDKVVPDTEPDSYD